MDYAALKIAVKELSAIADTGVTITKLQDGSIEVNEDYCNVYSQIKNAHSTSGLKQILIKTCLKAESISPRSAIYTLSTIDTAIKLLEEGKSLEFIENKVNDCLHKINISASRPTWDNLVTCFRPYPNELTNIIIEALKLAGSECKIFIEPSSNDVTSIERTTGYTFNIQYDPYIAENNRWDMYDVKCLIIDGTIVEVSEIDKVLRAANEEKVPLIIFARSFSDDVISTLRTNKLRKTLNVMPAVVPFDILTSNTLIDIACICNSDVFSALKGDLIHSITLESLPTIDKVTCNNSKITLFANKSTRIKKHITELVKRKQTEMLPATKLIIDHRLKSLSSSSVIIRVNDSGSVGSHTKHNLDKMLKMTQAFLKYGSVDTSTIKDSGLIKNNSTELTLSVACGLNYGKLMLKAIY